VENNDREIERSATWEVNVVSSLLSGTSNPTSTSTSISTSSVKALKAGRNLACLNTETVVVNIH